MKKSSNLATTPSLAGLMIHEWAFGAILAFLSIRSLARFGPFDPAVWIPMLLLSIDAVLITWDRYKGSVLSGRARLLFHLGAMCVIYVRLGVDVPRLVASRADDWLLTMDRRLLGETPAIALVFRSHPVTTELMSLCYCLFYPAMVFYHWAWILAPAPIARRFFAGLYCLYAVGFLGYSLMPASGPWVHLAPTFLSPLQGGPVTWLTHRLVEAGCNGVDVFPSLHCAVAAYLLGFDFLNGHRGRCVAWMAPGIGLCLATVYLRYHYAVDVMAGLILAVVALALAGRSNPEATLVLRPD